MHFCLQICALLFVSLYILCHFIITHFKKHTDFTAGRRAGAAGAGQPLATTFSLSGACSSIAFGLPRDPPVPPQPGSLWHRSLRGTSSAATGREQSPNPLGMLGAGAGLGVDREAGREQCSGHAPASPSTISLGFFPPRSA